MKINYGNLKIIAFSSNPNLIKRSRHGYLKVHVWNIFPRNITFLSCRYMSMPRNLKTFSFKFSLVDECESI